MNRHFDFNRTRDYAHDVACEVTDAGVGGECYLKPGARQQARDHVRDSMMLGVTAFFAACESHVAEIKEAMARDAKFADVIKDLFVTAVVGLAFGPGAAALDAASAAETPHVAGTAAKAATSTAVGAAKEAAHEGSKTAEFFKDQLKDITTSTLAGIMPESSDSRERTIAMIRSLEAGAISATMQALHELYYSADPALIGLSSSVKDPLSMTAVVDTIVERYREQIEPLGQKDQDDARNYDTTRNEQVTRATAWITGPGPNSPRLAVVKLIGERQPLMGAAARAVVGGGALSGEALGANGPSAEEIGNWIVTSPVEVEFVQFVDDRLAGMAEATGAAIVPITRLTNPNDAASGLL